MTISPRLSVASCALRQGRLCARRWGLYAGLVASWGVLALLLWRGPRGDSAGWEHVGVWNYLLNQCAVLTDYLAKVFWPHPLALDYGYAQALALVDVAPQALLLSAAGALTVWALWRNQAAGVAAGLFFLTLAPTSSLVPIATEVGAERRMYLPLAALLPLLAKGAVGATWQGTGIFWRFRATRASSSTIMMR